jgi:hypothetical protein
MKYIDRSGPRSGMKAFARATFRGYRGRPGEIQMKMPDVAMEVELFKERGNWKARAVETRGVFRGIEGPVEMAMRETAAMFDSQEIAWHWVDEDGQPAEAANEPRLSHLIGPPEAQQQFPRIKRTLCGRTVMSHRIEDRLEKVNCPQCRIALDKLPAE